MRYIARFLQKIMSNNPGENLSSRMFAVANFIFFFKESGISNMPFFI